MKKKPNSMRSFSDFSFIQTCPSQQKKQISLPWDKQRNLIIFLWLQYVFTQLLPKVMQDQ